MNLLQRQYFSVYYCALLLLVAVLTRWAVLGCPFIYADEEFYLFVGGQVVHGALPFVDIWDRKPIGLFLLYAVFHLFGTWRLYAYQAGALLSAWGTSCLMFTIARSIAPRWGAFLSGLLYLLWLPCVHGEGGQSSVFYELLVVLSVWLVVHRLPALIQQEKLRQTGLEVMILLGLSMQIKYTTLFEGIYMGCFLLWLGWRSGRSYTRILMDGILWIGMAILPTVLVFALYTAWGHGEAWWFANIRSMLLRTTMIDFHNLNWLFFSASLLLIGAALSWSCRPRQDKTVQLTYSFLLGWALTAFIGYAILREFPKHYSIPLFPPFFVLMACLWQRRVGQVWLTLMLILGSILSYRAEKRILHGPDMTELHKIQTVMSAPSGCAFMFTGQSILLDMLPYCPLTHYPFPAHLSFKNEQYALGVDPSQELRRVLAQAPLYLLDSRSEDRSEENPITRHIFDEYVHRYYRPLYEHSLNPHESDVIIYRRKAP